MSLIAPPVESPDPILASTSRKKLWQYDPDLYGKRDLRIDFLRGVAIVSMVVNHLECRSYFNNITQGHIYASSAEGFVFLSGFVLGFVTLQRIDKIGLNSAMQKLLERAKVLYITSFIMIAGLGLLSMVAPGMTRPSFVGGASPLENRSPGEWWQILLAAGTLHLAPPIVDILQLYVLCLLASPGIFWLLRRGLLLPLLTASWTLWWIQQVHPYSFSFQPLDRAHPYFVFSTWQILYVHGVAAGYHKDKLAKTWQRLPTVPLLLGMGAIVATALVTAHFDLQLGTWPTGVQDRALWLRLTDRSINGPIRLVTLLGLFSLMFMAVDRFWIPLSKTLGNLLIPLGQNSLYVYIIHVPLTLIWFMIPGLIQGSTWLVTLAQAIAIGLCWLMVEKEILFKIIPR